jgi:flavin-binding protein dodecin
MRGHVYRIIEIAGSSEVSHADAIDRAVERASETLKHLRWVEVKEQRSEIEGGRIRNHQVILKVGFTIDDRTIEKGRSFGGGPSLMALRSCWRRFSRRRTSDQSASSASRRQWFLRPPERCQCSCRSLQTQSYPDYPPPRLPLTRSRRCLLQRHSSAAYWSSRRRRTSAPKQARQPVRRLTKMRPLDVSRA